MANNNHTHNKDQAKSKKAFHGTFHSKSSTSKTKKKKAAKANTVRSSKRGSVAQKREQVNRKERHQIRERKKDLKDCSPKYDDFISFLALLDDLDDEDDQVTSSGSDQPSPAEINLQQSKEAFGVEQFETFSKEEDIPKLCATLGFADEEVTLSNKKTCNGKTVYSFQIDGQTFTASLCEAITPHFINSFFHKLDVANEARVFKPSDLVLSLLEGAYIEREANGTLTVRSVSSKVKSCNSDISERAIIWWLSHDGFTQRYRSYCSMLYMMFYYENLDLAWKSRNSVVSEVLRILQIFQFDDIIIQDSSIVQVFEQTKQYYCTKGSGAHRSTKRSASHKHQGNTRNHQHKYHTAYSLLTMMPVYLHITHGSAPDHKHVNYTALKRLGKILFIADRAYYFLHNLVMFEDCGFKFLVREKTSCQFIVKDAISQNGVVLDHLIKEKINSDTVKASAKEHQCISATVDLKRSLDLDSIPGYFIKQGYSVAPKNADQDTVTTRTNAYARMIVVYNSSVPEDQSDVSKNNQMEHYLYLLTNLEGDIAPMWTIFLLYKLRWDVELYFKSLKESYGLFKVNARNSNTISNIHCAAFASAMYSNYQAQCAGCQLEYSDSFEERKAQVEQYYAASTGVLREVSEFNRVIGALATVYRGEVSKTPVKLSAVSTDADIAGMSEDVLHARWYLRADSFNKALDTNDSRLAILLFSDTERKQLIIKALHFDFIALNFFEQLDNAMSEYGFTMFHSRNRLLEIGEKCISHKIDANLLFSRVKPPLSISMLQVGFYVDNTDVFRDLKLSAKDAKFSIMEQAQVVQAKIQDKAHQILDFCLSKTPNLRTLEKCGSKYMKLVVMEFQVLSMLKRLQDTDLRIPIPIPKAPNRASS